MSNLGVNNSLRDAYYQSMQQIPNRDYTEFARRCLHLEDSQIDDIQHDYEKNIKEQKFRMCKQWETSQVNPTVEKFKQNVNNFLRPSSVKGLPGEHKSVIIVFHEQVLPQVEKSRTRIMSGQTNLKAVDLLSCNDEKEYLPDCSSKIRKYTYRIFILTGKFETDHLENFMSALRKDSTKSNTLMILRKSSSVPGEMEMMTLARAKRMHRDDLFDIIDEFIQSNPVHYSGSRDKQMEANISISEQSVAVAAEECIGNPDYLVVSQELKNLGFPNAHHGGKHTYILIISSLRNQEAKIQNLVRIPWLRVFDFDPKSRVLGFLSKVEKDLELSRHFTTSDTKDIAEQPDDRTTNWVFLNGYCDQADVEFPMENIEISDRLIFTHCDSLVKYCAGRKIPKVIILWYPDANSSTWKQDEGLDQLTSSLRHHFNNGLDSFNCLVCLESKPSKQSLLGQMLKRLKLQDRVIEIPLRYLCLWIKENDDVDKPTSESKTLPLFLRFAEENGSIALSGKDEKWLSVCFDIVASNAPKPEQSSQNGENFLKGGKLDWEVIATGQYDATRDILDETIRRIKKQFIETGKSGIIRIFHAPGGGGTAFAKRVLWELRGDAPCLELFSMQMPIEEVKKRLMFIRFQTHLPAVLLIDGNSSQDAKTLLEYCRYEKVVILHVQRFYSLMNKKKKTEDIWLPENVSKNEAKMLLQIFSMVKSEKRRSLLKLNEDVDKDKKHCMFEYGLTAFESEYHGVKSYVHGNLQLTGVSMENWHKVLTYLSLAHYYGQCRLPSKLFAHLLSKASDQIVSLTDLPHQAQKFLVENSDGEWKITYYMVAKEILEQVLVQSSLPSQHSDGSKTLSNKARKNLCLLAINFIQFVRENVDHLCETEIPAHIQDILTSVLIKRNYKDAGENDEFGNKSKYSRLVEDAPSNDDKQKILEKLVEMFPSHAEFHAHLGRFYGITKQFEEAEKCFDKAFSVRDTERKKRSETTTNLGDPVLHRIHSMYGFYLNVQVRNEIADCRTQNKHVVTNVLFNAKKAIYHFRKSKEHYQKGCNPTYVFIGEIKVRLCLAEFALKISNGNISVLRRDAEPFSFLAEFVLESFSHCDVLLAQCMNYAEEHNIPKEELNFCINSFNTFYKDAEQALKHWVGGDKTVRSKKCHVAILKMAMKKEHSSKFQIYEHGNDSSRLLKLIALYEEIFQDTQMSSMENHHTISNYMTEWLQAIRHPLLKDRNYTLAQVNARVEYWDSKNERGSLATFYHYVLTTLLAINGPSGEVTNKYSEQSHQLKTKIKDCTIPLVLMERTSEWLSREKDTQSIKNIIHRNLLGKWEEGFWKKDETDFLKVCKGKIFTCKVWYGHIVLDGVQQPEVTVYFNPQRYGFSESEDKKKKRVEFYVGFNPNHGAEAYQVSLLEKGMCSQCKTYTEISKLGRDKSEWKSCCLKCDRVVSF